MEALLRIFVSAPRYNPVLLEYSLLAEILTQDEDPADSVPTNTNNEVDTKPYCMIQ